MSRAYLVGKANAGTKADATNDEHGKVLGKGTQDGANAEGSSPQNHDQLPATNASHRASEKLKKAPAAEALVADARVCTEHLISHQTLLAMLQCQAKEHTARH